MQKLEEIVLKNLSFYEAYGVSDVLLSISESELQEVGHLELNHIDKILKTLKKHGKVKKIQNKDKILWLRINPRRIPWYKKVLYKLIP